MAKQKSPALQNVARIVLETAPKGAKHIGNVYHARGDVLGIVKEAVSLNRKGWFVYAQPIDSEGKEIGMSYSVDYCNEARKRASGMSYPFFQLGWMFSGRVV
jgi:hypothetical protein